MSCTSPIMKNGLYDCILYNISVNQLVLTRHLRRNAFIDLEEPIYKALYGKHVFKRTIIGGFFFITDRAIST